MKYWVVCVLVCFTLFVKAQKNMDALITKHNSWVGCYVVFVSGDTLYGRIENRDFSFVSRDFRQPSGMILALTDETEVKLKPDDVSQLSVSTRAGGYLKYLSLPHGKHRVLYKVVVDGPCCLLHNAKEGLIYPSPNSQPISVVTINYSVYYKGLLADDVTEKEVYMIPASFRKKCTKVFADCPKLAAEVASNDYPSDYLFENCGSV